MVRQAHQQKEQRHSATDFGEKLAVPGIKRQLAVGRNIDRAAEHAFGELTAFAIPQNLRDPAKSD